MNETTLSAVAGIAFAGVGGLTVWLIFHATVRMKQKGASTRLIQAHRIGGYVFVGLFGLLTYYMVRRLAGIGDDPSSARSLVHMILAVALMPLIFVKVLIARYYKTAFYSALLPLGLLIYSLGFVMVTITVGPYLLRRATVEDIPLESVAMGTQQIDVQAAELLTQERCAKCHDLDRVYGARKDARGWLDTVNRMRAYPSSSISTSDAKTLVAYLVSRVGVDESTPKGEETVEKALVDSRCSKCHDLQQVYRVRKGPDEWKATVVRMESYAPEGHFKPGEVEQIVAYLSKVQAPEREPAAQAPIAEKPSAPRPVAPVADSAGDGQKSSTAFYVFSALVLMTVGGLALKRPGGGPPSPPAAPRPRGPSAPSGSGPSSTDTLELVRVVPMTHDAKTFRFRIPPDRSLSFKPGQFMTFTFEIDGRRHVRSYSISSSPTRAGYVEITVKRVPGGVVSVFLNDRAEPGLTVEAKGPAGRFTFDEARHKRLVLIAGGSGITPVMSILRTIDDRCVAADVRLVYAVRTPQDIIFGDEIAEIAGRSPHVRPVVVVSRPGARWDGPSGRITRELLAGEAGESSGATYFVCGPQGFMRSVRDLLRSMGVDDASILEEKFGGPPASGPTDPGAVASVGRARFDASGVDAEIPANRSLLEVAEINGVSIPFSCRQGQCGTCATRLVSGEVAMDAEDGLDDDARAAGFVLTCVGRGRGDVVLDA